jgi:Holliday junction DNA helicase RuvA
MIAWLEGRLLRKLSDAVVVDAGGVGYRVFVTQQVMERLPPEGSRVELEIHTQVREDAIQLFGFMDAEEREVFEALIGMSGIGPRAAVTVLSGIEARELARAVCSGDLARLCLVPGVGKKKAERMVLDLKERLMPLAQPQIGEAEGGAEDGAAANLEDLRSALKNLGFKGPEVEKAAGALREKVFQGAGLDVLLPEALKLVRG